MLKRVLTAIAAIVVLIVAYIATRPASFLVERSAVVAAPPAVVYAQLTDFGRWRAWSPWEKLDPAMTRTVSGTPGTVGHGYGWSGNKKVGEGRMTLTDLAPGERVDIRLEFLRPWKATHAATFTVNPEGGGSRITWSMSGTQGFFMKAMGLVMNMDKMVGSDFERGLQNLKTVAEADAAAQAPPPTAPPR